MENSGILNRQRWSETRIGFVAGLLCGALITMSLWEFNLSQYSKISVLIHEISDRLWLILSLPGLLLAQLLSVEWAGPNADDISISVLALIIIANACILGGIGAFFGWALAKLRRLPSFHEKEMTCRPTARGHKVMLAHVGKVSGFGFVCGFLLTWASFTAIGVFRGETLLNLYSWSAWWLACRPAHAIATVFGYYWPNFHGPMSLFTAVIVSSANSVLLGLLVGLVRAFYNYMKVRSKRGSSI